MPSLKDLRVRINSVKSTQKITSAMKMVAAAKLRRAQEQAEAGRPYADRMARMLVSVASAYEGREDVPPLLAGSGKDDVHLFVVVTSDRGLCGAFNSNIARETRRRIRTLVAEGRTVKLLCVGRKGRDQLRREYGRLIIDTIEDVGRPRLAFSAAAVIATRLGEMFEDSAFDVCTVVYNRFKSAISQIVTAQQLVPLPAVGEAEEEEEQIRAGGIYEYEPGEEVILPELLSRNLAVQVYRALLESVASEQGARMTAMDNATRNAGEMIDDLTLFYNRTRQAHITKELIEIISGAEAL
jgi:F-type H+-transporting ATPase subunit gamma